MNSIDSTGLFCSSGQATICSFGAFEEAPARDEIQTGAFPVEAYGGVALGSPFTDLLRGKTAVNHLAPQFLEEIAVERAAAARTLLKPRALVVAAVEVPDLEDVYRQHLQCVGSVPRVFEGHYLRHRESGLFGHLVFVFLFLVS